MAPMRQLNFGKLEGASGEFPRETGKADADAQQLQRRRRHPPCRIPAHMDYGLLCRNIFCETMHLVSYWKNVLASHSQFGSTQILKQSKFT